MDAQNFRFFSKIASKNDPWSKQEKLQKIILKSRNNRDRLGGGGSLAKARQTPLSGGAQQRPTQRRRRRAGSASHQEHRE